MTYDLAIVGSGGAAFAAAIAARREGRRVVMVERGTIGGTCVNTGCVPSKALLAAAEARHVALTADRFPGIQASARYSAAGAGRVDATELIAGKADLVARLRAEKYDDIAADAGWEIVSGHARFVDGPRLAVTAPDGGTRHIDAEHYLVATGSTPWLPPVDGLDEVPYLTSTTAMELDPLPRSLLVVGGNYVGLEQGQLFSRLGVDVTLVEALDRLAPTEEPELSAAIAQVFADEGIAVHTGARVLAVHSEAGEVVAVLSDGHGSHREVRAERVLVAAGRRPVTDGLDLDVVGVKVGERGQIVVDDQLRTAHPRIWAAGDVTGHPNFVYVAAAHGALVVENALHGAGRTVDYRQLPRVTFTTPAIAGVGMTEAQAAEHGIASESRVLPLAYVPRAVVNRDTRGVIKLVAERGSGRLLGAHAVADGAGDVIAAAGYALANHMTVGQIAELWHPYLTMAEGLKLAAQTFTRDVTKLSCCAA
ncbi:MAG: mercury(II) reductase [Micromonosporaceae bacterium]